jgi:hypothetical protein
LKSPIPDEFLRTLTEANERIARISTPDLDALKNIGVDLGTIEAVQSEQALLDTLKPERELLETLKETVKPEYEALKTIEPEREWFEALRPTFEAIETARAGWLKLGSEVIPELPNLEIDADLYKRLTSAELTGLSFVRPSGGELPDVSFITSEVEAANSLAAEIQLMGQVATAARKANYDDIAQAAENTASDAEAEPAELNWDALFDRLNDLADKINSMSDNLSESTDSAPRTILITIIASAIWYLIQIELIKLGIHP